MMPIGLGRHILEVSAENPKFIRRGLWTCGFTFSKEGARGNGPAVYWEFPGFQGKIGFISAISHKFCGNCNRIRMTAEGFLKPCLQFSKGADLPGTVKNGSR